MKGTITLVAAAVLWLAGMFAVPACGGSGANLDEGIPGYWIESDSSGALLIDNDGYGWGFEIARSGSLTVARLDWSAESLTTEATGPFGKLLEASDGNWKVKIDGEVSEGTYTLSTTTGEAGEHPFLTIDMGGAAYYVMVAPLQ